MEATSTNCKKLQEIGAFVLAGARKPEQLAQVAEIIRAACDYRYVAIYKIVRGEFVIVAKTGECPPAYPRFPITQGLAGAAVESKQAVMVATLVQQRDMYRVLLQQAFHLRSGRPTALTGAGIDQDFARPSDQPLVKPAPERHAKAAFGPGQHLRRYPRLDHLPEQALGGASIAVANRSSGRSAAMCSTISARFTTPFVRRKSPRFRRSRK